MFKSTKGLLFRSLLLIEILAVLISLNLFYAVEMKAEDIPANGVEVIEDIKDIAETPSDETVDNSASETPTTETGEVTTESTTAPITEEESAADKTDTETSATSTQETTAASTQETTTKPSEQEDFVPNYDREDLSSYKEGDYANSFRYYFGQSSNRRSGRSKRSARVTWQRKGNKLTSSNGISRDKINFGIDVSYHNNDIDWKQVKDSGLVDFAILRLGFAEDNPEYDDSKFARNVAGCRANGIPFGVYLYSYAYTEELALSEAEHCLRVLRQNNIYPNELTYPIYYDIEEVQKGYRDGVWGTWPVVKDGGKYHSLSNDLIEKMMLVFTNRIASAGYTPGVYSYKAYFENFANRPSFDRWSKWVAQVNTEFTYKGKADIWQCDFKSYIPGISTDVDADIDFSGKFLALRKGTWEKDSVGRWYCRADGSYPKNQWEYIDESWYYFDKHGYMKTGWLELNGYWYYLQSSGQMKKGWLKYADEWYYFYNGGSMAVGWVKDADKWYYLSDSGAMVTGWLEDSGNRYYLESSGAMISKTGWHRTDDGNWCYVKSKSGYLDTGWLKSKNKWYHLDSAGKMNVGPFSHIYSDGSQASYITDESGALIDKLGWVKDADGNWYYVAHPSGELKVGWLKYKDAWYYLNEDEHGRMLSDKTIVYRGEEYYLDKYGIWLP